MRKAALLSALAGLAVVILGVAYSQRDALAQSGGRTARPAHHETLWSWLKQHDYRKWSGPNGTAPDLQPGESPHGALIKTYVSKLATQDLESPPDGSVIVKENYSPDKKLMAITVMQRSAGYDPEHGNWYYAKYMPDGKIAKTPPEMKSMPIAGKFNMCIACHDGADGDDFLFFND
jgi:hypothetical protein